MSRKANRKINRTTITAFGCAVTTVGNEITLETPKATVSRLPVKHRDDTDREWLARDVFSTPYAEIRS